MPWNRWSTPTADQSADTGLHARACWRCQHRAADAGKPGRASIALAQSAGQPHAPQMLLLYDANPIFSAPPALRIREAIAKIPYIVSFGSFIDETSAQADLILPDHAPLESWLDSMPESGSLQAVVSLAPPAVLPLHDTRPMPDVLLGLAHQLGGDVAKALPLATYDAMLRAAFVPLRTRGGSIDAKTDDDFWDAAQDAGRLVERTHSAQPSRLPPHRLRWRLPSTRPWRWPPRNLTAPPAISRSTFCPTPRSRFAMARSRICPGCRRCRTCSPPAMWSSWVEINPKTGERLGIEQGDLVEIASPQGSVRAAAVLSPGIAPDMVAMPVGQGHENFGRFASGRGANPLSILAPLTENAKPARWPGPRRASSSRAPADPSRPS